MFLAGAQGERYLSADLTDSMPLPGRAAVEPRCSGRAGKAQFGSADEDTNGERSALRKLLPRRP